MTPPFPAILLPMNAAPIVDDLYKLRHSLAHVLAQAVLKLWPDTLITIGPPIETGCYYDFLFSEAISEEDFGKIEKEMKKIIHQKQTFRCDTLNVADAKKYWKTKKQRFKVELIEDLAKNDGVETVTHYANLGPKGEEVFVDLCRGGHVENFGEIPVDGFKIMSIAGAYWRGDEKREQLTRIYLAAFPSKAELDAHSKMLEEAAKVDHRRLGKDMGIFVISEVVGPGLPMLAPNGALIRQELEGWIREELKRRGYSFAYTPHIGRADLYKKSGHLSHFKDSIFPLMQADDAEYVLKPMNCPHHVEIYKSDARSYRDLPLRLAEFGTVYRYEKSGQVGGLTRVRGFTQDDAHLFMRPEQMEEEIEGILDLAFTIYRTLGFNDFVLRLSRRDPQNMEKYIGTPENWDKAEAALKKVLEKLKLPFIDGVGEAAFYGPKIDLIVKDVFGREWQLGTIPQVDYNMPERFDIHYTDSDGTQKRPIMMHRAIFGSFERFIGVLIEHFKGHFPLWLAPIQVALIPVAETHEGYASEIAATLKKEGMRFVTLPHTDSLGKRIREGETRRIPYLLVVGDKEMEAASVAVRNVKTKKQVVVTMKEFMEKCLEDIGQRKLEASIG
ncbi:threonine--tRNA ligase [Candidatus Peribacteria bacterium RIFCSPHIGHO2_02_FULL_53_20]|nr:MAG: threonine--tRNA ligase [Candidatus Peribacteria bacterium RIFCSPHIGHO2_02_FULL_53_20]OGJ72485.1 MAG: threonine--tRNA ligase [Candidatus Peribacteria bacterium RIFCSPLOWO2_12_FULL_53_10]